MADRTYMQIDILECPHANAGKVLQILSSYGFADESDGVLRLGPNNRYTVEEAPLGALAYELAYELLGLCSFSGWEDPKYEYPGVLVSSIMDSPQSELVTRQCLAEGEQVVTATDALASARAGSLGMLLHTDHQELLDLLYEKVKHEPDEIPIPHTVVIERQFNPTVTITYPDKAAALRALDHSEFVRGLCEEDCLSAYVEILLDPVLTEGEDGVEKIVPPESDTFHDDDTEGS